ncbi:MAG: DMT family transporter [Pseudomonadota bacterium]|nr:DMT family transporter [Pseudomonadota bacterium]
MNGRPALVAFLALLGAGWGMTQPLAKLSVSGAYRQFGIIFWQLVIGALLLGAITWLRGRPLPMTARHLRLYVFIALVGTLLPNAASLQAAVHLPAGIVSILLSLVPMVSFPMALALGVDRFTWPRMAGLGCGLAGVVLIVGPDAGLPDPGMLVFVPLALIAPVFYGVEGNAVAKWGTAGLDPIQLLFGASLVGAVLALPAALLLGQWISPLPPWGVADLALALNAVIHALVYAGYVWLLGRAGVVFAVQVSYLVTGFGVLWSMLLLDEAYSGWVWAAMALMFAGLFLVQPRPNKVLVPPPPVANDTG